MIQIPTLYFDGGSRGNPGKAAGAAVLTMPDGNSYTITCFLPSATCNQAEYTGLIIGLEKAKELGVTSLDVKGDSQLVINQMKGQWKIKSENIETLAAKAKGLLKGFSKVNLQWVARAENKLADAAANKCMDAN
ncbi:MAG: Bifunctional protein [Chroococcopsis gigantea SAG 12.99]|jgi:ribonuclease HI|nr:ribonuclease HI family protein [Chlorogloea purpurea SAG 13.99]MDV2998426.1 Bifunctional protein [Chroococcopsis gigantea SAG 12.99]